MGYWMAPTELLGVLGFGLAAVSLAWQILSRRPRLKLEIDRERSVFVTVEVRQNVAGDTVPEIRTGISLLVGVSNVSVRANTIRKITARTPAALEALPDNASFFTDVRVGPHPLYSKSMTEEVVTDWDIPGGWNTPHHLMPGDHHEAGLTYLIVGDPQPRERKLSVEVTVSDSHGKCYRTKVSLKHG